MQESLLDLVPLWCFFPVLCVLAWSSLELGWRLGRLQQAQQLHEKDGPVSTIVGSILGLLAFMLAFTFGLAANRFDERRDAVLNEANAIGTAYLRTGLLPEPQQSLSKELLRQYVDMRIQRVEAGQFTEVLADSEQYHARLWQEAKAAADKVPNPITGLYIQSLNDVIDAHSRRVLVGLRSRIPISIWFGLLGIAFIGMLSLGYQGGLTSKSRSPAIGLLILAFSGVLYLIADLDRVREGFLVTNQATIVDLRKSMELPKE